MAAERLSVLYAILCLNMTSYNACRFGKCWCGAFRRGSIRVAQKRRLHPWESEGAHLLLLFSEALIRADLLWEQRLLRRRAPMQMKSVASRLLVFKDFQAHKKKEMSYTCCGFMDTVVFLSAILKLSWTHNYSIFPATVVFLERLLNRALASVWILDSSLLGLPAKPHVNLFSIANDSDHTDSSVTGSCQEYTCHSVSSAA